MYVISLDHFLDDKGAVAIERGPARKVADFATAAVSYASSPRRPSSAPRPICFKCRKPKDGDVEIGLTTADLGDLALSRLWLPRPDLCRLIGRVSLRLLRSRRRRRVSGDDILDIVSGSSLFHY